MKKETIQTIISLNYGKKGAAAVSFRMLLFHQMYQYGSEDTPFSTELKIIM